MEALSVYLFLENITVMDVIINVSPVKYSYVSAPRVALHCVWRAGTLGDNSRKKGSRRKATKGPGERSNRNTPGAEYELLIVGATCLGWARS